MVKLKVGDRVCYSRKFLQSIGAIIGEMPQLRGEIVEIRSYGNHYQIAVVRWENSEVYKLTKVHTANLSRVSPDKGIEEDA